MKSKPLNFLNMWTSTLRHAQSRSTIKIHKMVAVGCYKGQPVVWATNQRRSWGASPWSYHAEELLVKKILARHHDNSPISHNWTIVVLRLKKSGIFGNSRPCLKCHQALHGLDGRMRVYFYENGEFQYVQAQDYKDVTR